MPLPVRIVVYASIAVLLLWLGLALFRLGSGGGRGGRAVRGDGGPSEGSRGGRIPRRSAVGASRTCPVCGSPLEPGERVHSKVFAPKGDRIMHIYGCPRCWPSNAVHVRACPVCEREVPREGYLVARLFERPGGAKHVHVLGCSGCRGARAT